MGHGNDHLGSRHPLAVRRDLTVELFRYRESRPGHLLDVRKVAGGGGGDWWRFGFDCRFIFDSQGLDVCRRSRQASDNGGMKCRFQVV